MRGRILLVVSLGLAALVACSKKDSLYIDPGKESSAAPEPAKSAPEKKGAGTPAETGAPAPKPAN